MNEIRMIFIMTVSCLTIHKAPTVAGPPHVRAPFYSGVILGDEERPLW